MFRELDLHGCSKAEAKGRLTTFINNLPKEVTEVTIIHGYSSTILMNYVQREFKHKRVKRKILTMNKGETIFLIEPK